MFVGWTVQRYSPAELPFSQGYTASVQPGSARNTALDGLRGYAAVAVVVYHAILSCNPHGYIVLEESVLAQTNLADRALKTMLGIINGELAVGLFFTMSGLVLCRALVGMEKRDGTIFGLSWRFLLRRVIRLWPVMAVCVVIHMTVLHAVDAVWPGSALQLPTLSDLFQNLTMQAPLVIGPTWTLQVELAGAPWLLLSYLVIRRWGLLRAVPAMAAGFIVLRLTGVLYHPVGMLTGLAMLLSGLLIEACAMRGAIGADWWRVALPVGIAVAFGNELFVSQHGKLHAALLLIGSALIVGSIATASSGRMRRMLEAPLSRFLGRISFSLYLLGTLLMLLLLGAVGGERAAAAPLLIGLSVGFCAVLLTIPIATLSERWMEQPSIWLGRTLTRRVRSRCDPVL
ncbi:MAG: acyltransferase [Oxalobacteraceae bacterium]|nr:MAG: acyltransferase [Oxalobacteraceae bacterium]